MKSRLISLLAALVFAVIAAGAVFLYTSTAELRALENQASATVLVSVAEIPAGTSLSNAWNQGLISVETFPVSSIPSNPIEGLDELNSELVALGVIAPGQILISSSFGEELARGSGLNIPDGKVAVAVDIGDTARVGNFVRPGNEVAIFITTQPSGQGDGQNAASTQSTTALLITRALVLAVGPVTTQNDTLEGQVPPSAMVTFAVTQSEAELLIHSRVGGTLHLSLLNEASKVSKTPGVTNENLLSD